MRGRRAARKMLRLAYAPPPVHHGVLTQFAPLLAALFPARWFQTTPAAARGRGRVHSKKSGIAKGVEQGNIKAQYQVYINPLHLFHQSHTHITQYLCCLCSFIFQLKMLPLLLLDPFGATSCSWNYVTSVDLRGACIRACFVPENCMCIRGMCCD
jgi:hypothetical protein